MPSQAQQQQEIAMKEFEMPEMPVEETEELDLLAEMPEEEGGEEPSPLADFGDEELIEELKKRGFEIEEPEVSEEMPEEEVEIEE